MYNLSLPHFLSFCEFSFHLLLLYILLYYSLFLILIQFAYFSHLKSFLSCLFTLHGSSSLVPQPFSIPNLSLLPGNIYLKSFNSPTFSIPTTLYPQTFICYQIFSIPNLSLSPTFLYPQTCLYPQTFLYPQTYLYAPTFLWYQTFSILNLSLSPTFLYPEPFSIPNLSLSPDLSLSRAFLYPQSFCLYYPCSKHNMSVV